MRKTKKILSLALAFVLILSSTSAFSALACTGFYVGKDASADGTAIIGHTVDAWNSAQAMTQVVPGVKNEPGRIYTTPTGTEYPLPDTTYQYITTPFIDGTYDGGTANEMGVAISSAVTCYVTDEINAMDPLVREGGLAESFMCALVAMCASTAREGVQVLADYIAKYGNAEHNSFFIADQNEVWYMETYTGHEWCAVKAPDDCVAVFGNQYMLGVVDVNSEDVLCSDGLVSKPDELGLAVYDEKGNIDLFATYSGSDLGNGANRRTWFGHVLFAPSTAGDYGTRTRYDLFYQPDEKITLDQVFEMTRARFEGTEWCPDTTGRPDQRVIGVERQVNINAIQVYSDLPAPMACVDWTTMANAEHSVYIPQSNLLTDMAESYKYIPEEGGMDEQMAHYIYKRLATLAEQDRVNYGRGVRDYWKSVETKELAEFPQILAETAALYETNHAAAAKYITDYTVNLQNENLAAARTMTDELMWYMILNNSTQKFAYDSKGFYMNDTITQKPFVPSLLETEDAQ